MKIGFVVEGDIDKLVIEQSLSCIPCPPNLQTMYYTYEGRRAVAEMRRGCWALAEQKCGRVIVFQDRNSRKECAPSIARRIREDLSRHYPKIERVVTVCVVEQEVESWILADAQCIEEVTGTRVPRRRTEGVDDAKEKLKDHLEEAFPKAYKVTSPTDRECIVKFIGRFDLKRASEYNRSADRFLKKCREIVGLS